MKTLFKNCYVLLGHDVKFTKIVIDGDKISYIGDDPKEYDAVKDMKGKLLMPGLVNAHAHGPMTLLRGIGSGLNLQDWLNEKIFPIEDRLIPHDSYVGEKWALIEMIRGGTTLVTEMYDFPWQTGEALLESQIKAAVCRVALAFSDDPEIPENRFNECIGFMNNFKDETDKVRAHFCIHSEYLSTEKMVRRIAESNSEYKKHVHVHLAETKKEVQECIQRHGKTPAKYFYDLGLFDNPVYAAHGVWCNGDDIRLLKEKNVSIVHNPTSNMKLGSGFAPIKKYLDNNINVALGTDGVASNNNLNMFEEMHLAAIIHCGYLNDPTAIKYADIIDMATINGAKALGFNDTGIIELGKKADIIALSLDSPNMFPAFEIAPLLCYSAQASDVTMTMVDGKILYEDGEFTTLDVDKAKFEMNQAIERLYK